MLTLCSLSLSACSFVCLPVLSRMQLGTATAEDLATLESLQSELTAGFALLPAEVQQQLGPAFAKITQILQTIHDELAAQIGTPVEPTAPSNATEPLTPEPAPAEVEPAVPEPAAPAPEVTPAPAIKHKYSVIKKKTSKRQWADTQQRSPMLALRMRMPRCTGMIKSS